MPQRIKRINCKNLFRAFALQIKTVYLDSVRKIGTKNNNFTNEWR